MRQIAVDADGNGGDMHDVVGFVGSQCDNVVDVEGRITTSIWSCAGCDEETFEYLYLSDPTLMGSGRMNIVFTTPSDYSSGESGNIFRC